jgi:trans-aconitate 2-methyltransferase
MQPPRDWDGPAYTRVSAPVVAMGLEVLDRLVLRGDERVLDAGCGAGGVTATLAARLPRGEVVAVDGSPSMIEQARAALPAHVETRVADLLELTLDPPADAILSTATFHWIADHDRLFVRLREALVPGGRIVAQCGGEGNIAAVRAAVDRVAEPALGGWPGPWHFASPVATEARLRAAGFTDVWCWQQHVRVEPDDRPVYLEKIILGSHLERLPAERHAPFVDAVLAELGDAAIDYVRLNVLARRPS